MEKSTILTIPGAKKSVLLDLITREVLLVSNSDIQTYIRLHNKIDSIEEEFIKQVSSHKVITSWLFLTLMCDLECSYCFEKNCQRMRQSVMTKKLLMKYAHTLLVKIIKQRDVMISFILAENHY